MVVYIDGACNGNPGKAAGGVCLFAQSKKYNKFYKEDALDDLEMFSDFSSDSEEIDFAANSDNENDGV